MSSNNVIKTIKQVKHLNPTGSFEIWEVCKIKGGVAVQCSKLLASGSNQITNHCLDRLADVLSGRTRKLSFEYLAVSDVTTAPVATDTMTEFIAGTDHWWVHRFEDTMPMGLTIVNTALLSFHEFNIPAPGWKRIGILDEYGKLLTQTLFDFSGKNSSNAIRVVYKINLAGGV